MTGEETQSPESIWTRQFSLPPALGRVAVVLARILLGLGAVVGVISAVLFLYYQVTLGPGARLELTDAVSIRVPRDLSAFEYRDSGIMAAAKTYLISDPEDEHDGLIAVRVFEAGKPAGFRDLARSAAYSRKMGREVEGPATFQHSGFDVVAIVEPTRARSRNEGKSTLTALVDVNGQLVEITGDDVTLGVSEQDGPRVMAEAAIDLLRLAAN